MPRLPQQARRRAKCRCVAADHEMRQAGGIGTSFSVPVGYVGAATGALACALAGKIIQRALRQNKAGAVKRDDPKVTEVTKSIFGNSKDVKTALKGCTSTVHPLGVLLVFVRNVKNTVEN